MASATELQKQCRDAYDALKDAIDGSANKWASARPAAESVLRSELEYAVTIAETMEAMRLPERKTFTLESKEEALSALSEVAETCNKYFGYVMDSDLEKSTPMMENIGGVLEAAAEQASSSAIAIKGV